MSGFNRLLFLPESIVSRKSVALLNKYHYDLIGYLELINFNMLNIIQGLFNFAIELLL